MRSMSRAWLFGCVILLSVACGGQAPQGQTQAAEPRPKKAKHPFRLQAAEKWTAAELESETDPTVMPFDPTHAAGAGSQLKARFSGKHRADAKTSIVGGAETEEFLSVVKLQANLPTDDKMRKHHDPKITTETMDRVPEEERSVRVDAWVYAIKYEDDNDWHLIIGTDPERGEVSYFNAEVSGLPKSGQEDPAFATLLSVRRSLADMLNNDLPGRGSYQQYDPPFPVTIEGSVFYDVDHLPGVVGPEDPPMKPTTSWEIHPITTLTER